MRILLLCDRVPDSAGDGLLLRVLNLAQALLPRHRIDLLCLRQPGHGRPPAAGLFDRVWEAPPGAARPSAGWRAPFVGWGAQTLYTASDALRTLFARTLDPADYDVIWDAGAVLLAHLPPRWDGVPLVADLVDDMVLTFRRAMHSAPALSMKLRYFKYAHVFGRFEAETMRRATHCVVVGDEDAASFARASRVPVAVVANGVDTAFYAPVAAAARPAHLVFEGTMSFPPNEQAAFFLVREVMPRVWAARPDATLALVGREPSAALRALAGAAANARITVTGAVDDVRQHVRAAEVFVCPLLSGAGIKNKLLQAWAMGLPVVATRMSVGGLGARDGVELLLRDGAQALADGVIELLDDPARRAALGAAGRAAAVQRFDWAAMALAFEALLEDAARQAPGGSSAGGSRRV